MAGRHHSPEQVWFTSWLSHYHLHTLKSRLRFNCCTKFLKRSEEPHLPGRDVVGAAPGQVRALHPGWQWWQRSRSGEGAPGSWPRRGAGEAVTGAGPPPGRVGGSCSQLCAGLWGPGREGPADTHAGTEGLHDEVLDRMSSGGGGPPPLPPGPGQSLHAAPLVPKHLPPTGRSPRLESPGGVMRWAPPFATCPHSTFSLWCVHHGRVTNARLSPPPSSACLTTRGVRS